MTTHVHQESFVISLQDFVGAVVGSLQGLAVSVTANEHKGGPRQRVWDIQTDCPMSRGWHWSQLADSASELLKVLIRCWLGT